VIAPSTANVNAGSVTFWNGPVGTVQNLGTAAVATSGVNISVAYLATRGRAVLVTSDNERAREALQT